jgi:hypothetical protein
VPPPPWPSRPAGPHVDAGADQLGGRVVPHAVQVGGDAEAVDGLAVPLAHAVRQQVCAAVRRCVLLSGSRENTKASGATVSPRASARPWQRWRCSRSRVFGFLVDPDDAALEVDPGPAERARLAPAGAGGHGHPDERAPVGVGERGGQDLRGLGRRRWSRVRPRRRRRVGLPHRAHGHPAPPDRLPERPAQDEVDPPDGRRAQGAARVRPAAVVAVVPTLT